VGHLEGFARAANRGAPVTLAAVTVWRKFYFVSAPLPLGPQGTLRWPDSVEELLSYASENNIELSNTPRNSPISAILEQLTTNGKPPNALSLPPQQLSLELLNGQRLFGLMPEPISTSVILKNPSLKIIGSLEEEYARRFGGPDIMPQAGVAVNTSLAEQNPPLIQNLIDLMGKSVSDLSGKPIAQAAALLPEEVHQALGEEVLLKSLEREPLIAKGASLVRQEIDNFLHLAAPELFEPGAPALPSDFIFEAK
jgi:NitT/TauT family transport system substrate-binding protein